MQVLRTSNFQGGINRPIVPRHKHSIVLVLFTTKFSSARFSCADNLFVQKSRLNMKLESFPALGMRAYERKLTKRAFKRKIHQLLLAVLEIEDYYVDAHSVILNLNTSNCYTL